jgi:putative polyhydroxyalkanoate system protein
MPDIKLRRSHKLGLPKARKLAWKWAEKVEEKFGMECTVVEGEHGDTVAFERSGVSGELRVAPDHFDLHARLGFLLGAFSKTIEAEIEKELDALLGQAAPRAASHKPAAPPAAPRSKRKPT